MILDISIDLPIFERICQKFNMMYLKLKIFIDYNGIKFKKKLILTWNLKKIFSPQKCLSGKKNHSISNKNAKISTKKYMDLFKKILLNSRDASLTSSHSHYNNLNLLDQVWSFHYYFKKCSKINQSFEWYDPRVSI